jgi:hypothetical protein
MKEYGQQTNQKQRFIKIKKQTFRNRLNKFIKENYENIKVNTYASPCHNRISILQQQFQQF